MNVLPSNYTIHHGGLFETVEEAEAASTALRLRLHSNNLADR